MPRLYSKRVGTHLVDNRVRKRTEERDAIVWQIDQDNDIIYLKLQGSDTLVRAYYHQVVTTIPAYLKTGSAATIRFRRGNKGYVDVIGSGRAIPTPVASGSALPEINLADMILTGMEVTATSPATMSVAVAAGTYRIANQLYVFSGTSNFVYVMDDPPPLLMGTDDVTMGPQYFTIDIPAAPSTPGYGRYDILVVGTDQEIDVISGTAVNLSTTAPTMPSVPLNHILVAYIFVQYGNTVVTQDMIGQNYASPVAETVTVVLSGSWVTTYGSEQALDWNPLSTPNPDCTITISAIDQYGGQMNWGGARGRLTKAGGFGQLYGSYSGWKTDWVESQVTTQAVFKYQRDQSVSEISPVLYFEVTGFAHVFSITLLSATGLPVDGQ